MGRIPWERQLTCQSLIRYLEQGGRMARPDYANDETYVIELQNGSQITLMFYIAW